MSFDAFCIVAAVLLARSIALNLNDVSRKNSLRINNEPTEGECSVLTNVEGTHYTIAVEIGSPPQKFDLVADTGSPWVIVEDCKCKQDGYCDAMNKCFTPTDSATFTQSKIDGKPGKVVLQFGSGPIEVEISSDYVALAHSPFNDSFADGVLTMVDHMLSFSGQFEGIFGLGLDEHQVTLFEPEPSTAPSGQHFADGWLGKVGVTHFTICLDDDIWTGESGTLLLNGPRNAGVEYKINVDTMHWQIALNGATVEGQKGNVGICDPKTKTSEQDSACAAILDSGTTYILGPDDQINQIFAHLCEQWPRCNKLWNKKRKAHAKVLSRKTSEYVGHNKTANRTMHAVETEFAASPDQMFELLINDCNSWYNDKIGLTEIPSLTFLVSSGTADGDSKELKLEPWTWVVTEKTSVTKIMYAEVAGIDGVPVGFQHTNKTDWVCTLAFGTMDYPTVKNGPAWILGVPLFYAYSVDYDMATKPPSVGFSADKCTKCQGTSNTTGRRFHNTDGVPRLPRRMTGDPHLPKSAKRVKIY